MNRMALFLRHNMFRIVSDKEQLLDYMHYIEYNGASENSVKLNDIKKKGGERNRVIQRG